MNTMLEVPHPDYVDLFVKGHGIEFKAQKKTPILEETSESWNSIFNELNIKRDSVVLVCGSKNNGKSSLLRHMINYSLKSVSPVSVSKTRKSSPKNVDSRYDCVYHMDCDPGQPELTSPGLVSAHVIRKKLRSPQYLNVWQHEEIVASSVAGINMNIDPVVYVDNCSYVYGKLRLYRQSRDLPPRPIFINTMGWVRNIGQAMLIDLIKLTCPTHVVVLNVPSEPLRILYASLDAETLRSTPFSFYHRIEPASEKDITGKRYLGHSLHVYDLSFAFPDSQATARLNRSASQLAYLSPIRDSMYMPLLRSSAKRLSLDRINVYCCASYPLKARIVMELLPNAWVHLCVVHFSASGIDRSSPIGDLEGSHTSSNFRVSDSGREENGLKVSTSLGTNQVLGCGLIVRVVDTSAVYIVTPLDETTLNEQVNCIVKPLGIPFAPEANMSYQDNDVYDQTQDLSDMNLVA